MNFTVINIRKKKRVRTDGKYRLNWKTCISISITPHIILKNINSDMLHTHSVPKNKKKNECKI